MENKQTTAQTVPAGETVSSWMLGKPDVLSLPPSFTLPTPTPHSTHRSVLLTDAVSGWGHVEARLAAQDTAVGTRAVLTPPGSTHWLFLVLTLINICPQGHERGQICG